MDAHVRRLEIYGSGRVGVQVAPDAPGETPAQTDRWISSLRRPLGPCRTASNKAETPAPAPVAPGPQPSDKEDVLGQLKSLGELRDAGVVTPEEFEAKKADLLKRL